MHIAIEGCSHGELDVIYDTVVRAQETAGLNIDLLICCGDFQSVRNTADLKCMAVPLKYMNMHSFYKYYSGEKTAPVLTLFIGGNHEASNYLQELPYGGWVAPNIYYLGYGSVINIGGLRIGGLSGIYKGPDYLKGRYEKPPYTDNSIRSVYHVRSLEVFRFKQLDTDAPLDIFLSHDWPRGVTKYGDFTTLCRKKKHFKDEVDSDTLGSRAAQELLEWLQPRYWFAGHLHVKFAALIRHTKKVIGSGIDVKKIEKTDDTSEVKTCKPDRHTRFLALDKCLPRRDFLQILEIKQKPSDKTVLRKYCSNSPSSSQSLTTPSTLYDEDGQIIMHHDLEWLTILRLTNHLLKTCSTSVYMPGPGATSERYQFTPTVSELEKTLELMDHDLRIKPESFIATVEAYNPETDAAALKCLGTVEQPQAVLHPYTLQLCAKLNIDDPVALMLGYSKKGSNGRKSKVFSTPVRKPTNAEMNVTLDTSKVVLSDVDDDTDTNDYSFSCSDSGDIVFEMAVNSPAPATSDAATTPLRRSSAVRKALRLSTPRHDVAAAAATAVVSVSVASSLPTCTSSPDTPALCSPSRGSPQGSLSQDSSSQDSSHSSAKGPDNLSCKESDTSLNITALSSDDSPSQVSSESSVTGGVDTLLPESISASSSLQGTTNDPTMRKRLSPFCEEVKHNSVEKTIVSACDDSRSDSVSTPAEVPSKPTKIRRRNAAIYANDD